jgi:ribosomal protein S16
MRDASAIADAGIYVPARRPEQRTILLDHREEANIERGRQGIDTTDGVKEAVLAEGGHVTDWDHSSREALCRSRGLITRS